MAWMAATLSGVSEEEPQAPRASLPGADEPQAGDDDAAGIGGGHGDFTPGAGPKTKPPRLSGAGA